ncbi:unnamed protein product [Calypogeia fissa]
MGVVGGPTARRPPLNVFRLLPTKASLKHSRYRREPVTANPSTPSSLTEPKTTARRVRTAEPTAKQHDGGKTAPSRRHKSATVEKATGMTAKSTRWWRLTAQGGTVR